jgi:hypothetical protein
MDSIPHPAESDVRVARAGVGDRAAGEVPIVDQHPSVSQGQHHLLLDERPADGVKDLSDGRDRSLVARLQRPTDAAVVGPARLGPGLRNDRIPVQGMGAVADVPQIRTSAQDGDQEQEQLALGRVLPSPLGNGNTFQPLHQADPLRKQPPRHQHRVGGEALRRAI